MNSKHKTPSSLLVISGVRPQYVKCAALQRGIEKYNSSGDLEIIAHYINSGQHYDDSMSGVFIRELSIHFDYTISHQNKSSTYIMGNMISQIGEYIQGLEDKPDWVIVFGDANTTLAGAIAANKSKCRVAHFEAGTAVKNLKTPEIINGRLLAHLADLQFCSTELAAESLRKQGITENIHVVGDIAREFVMNFAEQVPNTYKDFEPGKYILLTLHREENLESETILPNILNAVSSYSKVLFVTHPRTQYKLSQMGIKHIPNIDFVPALSYTDMLSAIKGCKFIITDSGGLQREAYYLGKRCLVCSDVDFWPSLRLGGVHTIINSDQESIRGGFKWMEDKLRGSIPSIPDMDRPKVMENTISILLEQM
jgi:UDP-N-acetylglucosamine 2-epimerase